MTHLVIAMALSALCPGSPRASVGKTCKYIAKTAQHDVQLVSFVEAFIPDYPAWIWTRSVDPALSTRYVKNCRA